MKMQRREVLALSLAMAALPAWAADRQVIERDVVTTWYRLVLELVRHTATYSPPVASRAFAYIGIAAHESLASGNRNLVSLAGQLNGLQPTPPRAAGEHDEACVLHAALAASSHIFFANTGPTGQRAMTALGQQVGSTASAGIAADVVARSIEHGQAIAAHIHAWSLDDGGAVVENMGFPATYTPGTNPQDWVPTSLVRQQQAPLLPNWGNNRPFAMPAGNTCTIPAPPAYSEDLTSPFGMAAQEVYDTVVNLTDEQRRIARFWSDDPMLSPTPPGHWISIVLTIADRDSLPADRVAEVLAKLGVAVADGFIGCWAAKFEYNLLRPVTYIRRFIDPKFEPILNTPPFPEYPSGHSTQSGAAATVLTAAFGENFAFDDTTHDDEGLPTRSFTSFWQAAEEAGISRLYGGIHYRFGVEEGLTQGRCIGNYATALKTRV
ncbi:vanadium-dependent haloperoxidase [Tabrizicola sp.]|uniref:vanadium-dependent haloperoxidase n=1 Tax=Tabrizicola sp. TaxID=2005166 RepID=UPI00286B8208|nr:vanadium-dependent haloperoxidase [Tabrizicola sp.]